MTEIRNRTIWVTARRNGHRLSRLKIVYPQWITEDAKRPAYNTALARQLLALTGEIPASKRALIAVLAEYRHALHALALASETPPARRASAHRPIAVARWFATCIPHTARTCAAQQRSTRMRDLCAPDGAPSGRLPARTRL